MTINPELELFNELVAQIATKLIELNTNHYERPKRWKPGSTNIFGLRFSDMGLSDWEIASSFLCEIGLAEFSNGYVICRSLAEQEQLNKDFSKELLDLSVEAFVCVCGDYGDNIIETSPYPFNPIDRFLPASELLVKNGYMSKSDYLYRWSDKVGKIMTRHFLWKLPNVKEQAFLCEIAEDEKKSLLIQMVKSMPKNIRDYILLAPEFNLFTLAEIIEKRWDGESWTNHDRKETASVLSLAIATQLTNLLRSNKTL